jgi:hypothetical protein
VATRWEGADERKFGKSRRNRRTENAALSLLLTDRRFRSLDSAAKRRLLQVLEIDGEFSTRTFDAVMGDNLPDVIDHSSIDLVADRLRLIEMKSTNESIGGRALNGFFFGATKREYDMASRLGERFLFAFVVLRGDNEFGAPFFVLLTLDELEARTRTKRIQYQVNLRTDMASDLASRFGAGPSGLVDRAPLVGEVGLWNPGPAGD